jgi:hypothetical protein
VLEVSGEVTGLKTKLGRVGTGMKGVTDTISELTNDKKSFLGSLVNDE